MRPALLLLLALVGCAGHEREVVDPLEVLRDLELTRRADAPRGSAPGLLSLDEATAWALERSPALRARRAALPVASAARAIAETWPDPEVEWQANNVIADYIVERKSGQNSYVAGFQAMIELPRPGELDARSDVAAARFAREAVAVRAAEADLARDVRLAYAALLRAEAELALDLEAVTLAERLRDDTDARRATGQVTDLEVGLVRLPVELARATAAETETAVEAARQELNRLLGLAPDERWRPTTTLDALAAPAPADVAPLVSAALTRRPDVSGVVWEHREADATLALELAGRWPRLAIGTGISFELPIFSQFNWRGVERARLARAQAREAVVARVNLVRAEVHSVHARARAAQATLASAGPALEAGADDVIARARAAQAAGQAPVAQELTARLEVLTARRRALALRADAARATIDLDAATGALAPREP